MTRLEYIAALKTALAGLPPELIQDMVNAYEMRFIEGASAGRSEEEIVAGLDTPPTVAARLRIALQSQPTPAAGEPIPAAAAASPAAGRPAGIPPTPTRVGRMLATFLGLGMFNLFLVIPSIVFCSLLFASWVCSGAFILTGSAYTAASMSGINQITVDGPAARTLHLPRDMPAVVHMTSHGIHGDDDIVDIGKGVQVVIDEEDRVPSLMLGLGAIFGGIFLFLLNLVITKYSFLGIVRYLKWNLAILRNV
jgi:uncharacterized membrane protein